jgi:putative FmdB family regulatory protein
MPTYDYECPKCGHTFEAFQLMSDKPLARCPSCKKTGVRRLPGAGAGFVFKGSGFYETDFKTKKGAPPAKEPKPAAPNVGENSPNAANAKPAGPKPADPKAADSKAKPAGPKPKAAESK